MASPIADLMKPGFTTGDPFEVAHKEQKAARDAQEKARAGAITMEELAKMAAEKERSNWEKERWAAEREDPATQRAMKAMAEHLKKEEEKRKLAAEAKAKRQQGIERLNQFIDRMRPLVADPVAYLREGESIPESATTVEAVFEAAVDYKLLDDMILDHSRTMTPANMITGDRTKDLHLEALQALADEIAEIADENRIEGTLSGPVRLAVVLPNGNRSTSNMIGGETFRLLGAHISNSTGALWLHMRPDTAERFTYAEVSLEFVKEGHFGELFDRLEHHVHGGIVHRCKELAKIKMIEREKREMAEKQEQYADFGSW